LSIAHWVSPLLPPISGLTQWAMDNVGAIHAAQDRYDEEHDQAQAA